MPENKFSRESYLDHKNYQRNWLELIVTDLLRSKCSILSTAKQIVKDLQIAKAQDLLSRLKIERF